MIRVLSSLVLIPLALSAIWFAPHGWLVLLLEAVLLIAFVEYADLAAQTGVVVPKAAAGTAAVVTCAAVAWPEVPLDLVLIAAFLAASLSVLGAYQPAPHVPASAAAVLFPAFYLGLPIGTLAATRYAFGREALLLMLLVVWVSDSAQFYVGSVAGRHGLSPATSPKKSVEGALGGLVAGTIVMVVLGRFWLPALSVLWLVGLGAVLVTLGIAGDLFESLLKRSAKVKDSSGLIPGHGGVLDRIDSLLFVAPGYYLFLRLLL
ncbi:MAG: phosphatidate cytidylyltransferase [Acidobacteriota bacterium]